MKNTLLLKQTNPHKGAEGLECLKNRLLLSLFLFIMLFPSVLKAADYVETTIVSGGEEYNLLMAIPDNFNSSATYSLVVGLQPCMDAPTKNYLQGLAPLTDSLKMIVVCPDLSKTGNWMNEDNYGVILTCIDSAMAQYSINPESVFLTGMSCNGATTIQEGLKKVYPFKGIFPWDPYLSTVDNKSMDLNSDMPITIAVGTSDDYLGATLNMYDSLKTHGANVNLVLVEGINHTYSFPEFGNEMIHAFYYLLDTNSISIQYLENELSDFEIFNDNPAIELSFQVSSTLNENIIISAQSSKPSLIANPEITYTPENGNIILKFVPTAEKSGKSVIVLEAKDKNGTAYEQVSFKVIVNKAATVAVKETKALFEVYPNPANTFISVNGLEQGCIIEIFDLKGKIMLQTINTDNANIDITFLKKGLYILRAKSEMKNSNTKFIVE